MKTINAFFDFLFFTAFYNLQYVSTAKPALRRMPLVYIRGNSATGCIKSPI